MKMKHLEGASTIVLDQKKCVGCKMCIDVCPHAVFSQAGKKVTICDRDACMECGACALNCPVDAISVKKGVGCAFAIINGIMSGTAPSCDCSGNGDGGKGDSCCG